MKYFLYLFLSCIFVFATEWKLYDLNTSLFKPINRYSGESFDFSNNTNVFLSRILESGSAADNTINTIDFNSKTVNIKNINLLYENHFSSLLFQRELFVDVNYVNYYNGLVNRFYQGDFTFGFNGFINTYQENKLYTFGSEFAYGNYFKFFTNYYDFDDKLIKDDTEIGINLRLPIYSAIGVDFVIDSEKSTQSINYSPYPIFNISLIRQDYQSELPTSTSIFLNFNINYNLSFKKHFKKNNFQFKRYNNYDFLKNRYIYWDKLNFFAKASHLLIN